MSHQLPDAAWRQIDALLRATPGVERAVVFGSRALGSARKGSDIDIAVWGALSQRQLAALLGALEALPLPWRFDLVHVDDLRDEGVAEHIARFGKPIASLLPPTNPPNEALR